jgi:hypothetical protein
MRRVIVTTLLTILAGLAAAQECGYQGADFYSVPTTTLMIPQLAPAVPSLNGNKYWQIALCNPQPFSVCQSTPAGNIIEINGAQTSCDTNFVAQSGNPTATWDFMYGGIHTIFYGQYSKKNDRVANVTVYCDPGTPSIAAHGPSVLAFASPTDSSVWNFNIELKSTYACSGNPTPPSTPNPPGPNTPSPGTPSPGTPSPWAPITPHPPPPAPPGPEPSKPKESESPVAIVFVVLVFVLPAIYVGIFVGLNYKNGKRGRELLPHPEFWRDFPWLIVDGFKFTKNKFMQCIKKGDGSGTYGPYNGGGEATYKNVS